MEEMAASIKGIKNKHHETIKTWNMLEAESISDYHWLVFSYWLGTFLTVISSGLYKGTNKGSRHYWAEPLSVEDLGTLTRWGMHC